MAEAARIFISHSHQDIDWCRAFISILRGETQADVWYDEHNLGYGLLMDEIERELSARPIFIVIFSPDSVASQWVRRETNAAIHLQDRDPTRIVLPVMATRTEIPLLWAGFKRISGPDDAGLPADEAAHRTIGVLALTVPEGLAPPLPPISEGHSDHDRTVAAYQYEHAQGLFAQDRDYEALVEVERALERNPAIVNAWNIKSRILLHRHQFPEAIEAAERALALESGSVFAWSNKGVALLSLRRDEEALEAFNHAVRLDPGYANAWAEKISVLQKLGRTAEAREAERQRDQALHIEYIRENQM
jgi:tetratricopeptide (TPR) repeat protein